LRKKKEEQAPEDLIPIGDSVKLLDERYPHLRGIRWNSKDDEEEEE
jgi:hypothetical protein